MTDHQFREQRWIVGSANGITQRDRNPAVSDSRFHVKTMGSTKLHTSLMEIRQPTSHCKMGSMCVLVTTNNTFNQIKMRTYTYLFSQVLYEGLVTICAVKSLI